ncbi:hypothetical protein D3C72_2560970 [compost metagenome]
MLCCGFAHFDESSVEVAFVKLMVTTHIDDWALEGSVRPQHSLFAHRYVAGKDNQIRIDLWRFKTFELNVQI